MANNVIYPPARRTGTGFLNLSKYLKASEQAPLGQTIARGISGTAEEQRKRLGEAQEQFQKGMQGTQLGTPEDIQRRQDVLGRIAGYQAPQAGTPSNIISDEDIEQFKKFRAGEYKGPTELENATKLGLQAKEAEALGKAAGTEGGRFSLLSRFIGGPQYTLGQRRLDELVLGKQDQGIKQAGRQTAGLTQETARQTALARGLGEAQRSAAKQFASQTESQLGTQLGDIQKQISSNLTAAREGQERLYQQRLKDLTGIQELNDPSLIGSKTLYGVDPTRFLIKSAEPTAETVTSLSDLSKQAALQRLSGLTPTEFQAQRAGTFKPEEAVQLEREPLLKSIQIASENYQNDLRNVVAQRGQKSIDAVAQDIRNLNKRYNLPENYHGSAAAYSILDPANYVKETRERNPKRAPGDLRSPIRT